MLAQPLCVLSGKPNEVRSTRWAWEYGKAKYEIRNSRRKRIFPCFPGVPCQLIIYDLAGATGTFT